MTPPAPDPCRTFRQLACGLLCAVVWGLHADLAQAALQSIGFYYGPDTTLDELHAFDVAVVDPDQGFDPVAYRRPGNELYAYVSVGEVNPSRAYAPDIRPEWKLGTNTAWSSSVLDQRDPTWQAFFLDRIVAPLWAKGYRGFFLDTLDSYQLGGAKAEPAQQQAGLIKLIKTLRQRFPGIHLIANRGFELLPQIAGELEAVAAESLFRGWEPATQRYREVPAADRTWLQAQLAEVKQRYGLPVIAIDYVAPTDRALARATARQISQLGYIPWVADARLHTLGISRVEVIPRRVLIVYDGREAPGMHYRAPHQYVEMLLNYYGYVAEYADATQPLPEPDQARYAGIVTWFDGGLPASAASRYARWLTARIGEGWRVAMFDDPGFAPSAANLAPFGLEAVAPPSGPLTITAHHREIGYETPPLPQRRQLIPVRLAPGRGTSWLPLTDAHARRYDGVALTAWGGFAFKPFGVARGVDDRTRWVVNPWAFLQQALALPALPVPDTTSDAGRRLLFAHMDGDGFPSRAEFPGSPYGAQIVLDEIVRRYPEVPHTLSVIEGEISPHGLNPKDSPALEAIARRMFALPNVEVATHTYSHPFRWAKVEAHDAGEEADADYHLVLPGYVPSLEREITGSAAYASTLAPAGKPVRILLWSGDAAPSPSAMAFVHQSGLLNLNGGNTMATFAYPSITQISPLGARLGNAFQVFAPVTNEDVYTNLWRGPFYGFKQAIETFTLTGAPRRIKPIDIYFHTYAGTKPASLKALRSVYEWAQTQATRPVFASEFIQIADAFNHVVLARDLDEPDLLVRNAGALRSLRAPDALGEPDLDGSQNLAGWHAGPDGNYLILTATEARLRFTQEPQTRLYLASANGAVTRWEAGHHGAQAELKGHAPLDFELGHAQNCTVLADRHPLTGTPAGALLRFKLQDATATLDIRCRGR